MNKSTFSDLRGLRPIVAENLRRFWPFALVAFLILFVSVTLPLLILRLNSYAPPSASPAEQFDAFRNTYDQVGLILSGMHPGFLLLTLLLPIITTVLCFRYLHQTGSVAILHSMPRTRGQFFAANLLSSFALSIGPLLAAALTILPFLPPLGLLRVSSANSFILYNIDHLPAFSDWLVWFGITLVCVLFVTALSAVSAMLTGNAPGQFALSVVLNFIVPLFYMLIIGLWSTFLIGFGSSDETGTVFLSLHPIFGSVRQSAYNPGALPFMWAVWIVCALVLLWCARRLYGIRKLERAGDSVVFTPVEQVLAHLLTLLGTCGIGMVFYLTNNQSIPMFLLGCVFGAVLSFLIVWMILKKTPRIFTKASLRAAGVFAVIAVVFLSCTAADITGFQNRLPNPALTQRAALSFGETSSLLPIPYGQTWLNHKVTLETRDTQEIKDYIALQQKLIQMMKTERAGSGTLSGTVPPETLSADPAYADKTVAAPLTTIASYTTYQFDYWLGGLFPMHRVYAPTEGVPFADARAILSGAAFRDATTLAAVIGDYRAIELFTLDQTGTGITENKPGADPGIVSDPSAPAQSIPQELNLTAAERVELATALDEDYRAASFEELTSPGPVACQLWIAYRDPASSSSAALYATDASSGLAESYATNQISYTVPATFERSLAWLRAKGYYNGETRP